MAAPTESYAGKIQRKLLKKQRVIEAASGRQKADLVLKNATYVCVFSNQLRTCDIAVANGMEFGELLDNLEAIVYSGTKINIDYFIYDVLDEEHVEDIFQYFKESDTDSLESALDELGEYYTEEEIRLVRIKFISEMAN